MAHWLLVLLVSLLIAVVVRQQFIYLLVAGVLLGYVSHGLSIEKQRIGLLPFEKQPALYNVTIRGVVIDTGKQETGPYLVKVLESKDLPGGSRVLLSLPGQRAESFRYGDIVTGTGKLARVGEMRNPHGFDRARWLHRQGADVIFIPDKNPAFHGVSKWRIPVRTMAEWRGHIRGTITAGIPPGSKQAQLIRAVVLGERPPRTSAMIQDFRESGTLHVFAVSGLHVGMVGVIIAAVLWLLHVPRWVMVTGVVLSMAVYAGVTGMNPPSVRAVIMAAVFLSGFLIQRKPSLINSLAASAVIVLLYDGHQLFTPGFQLSYGVLLAIALATSLWTHILKPLGEFDPFLPRSLLNSWQEFVLEKRRWFRGSLAVSMAAWMGSAPLMWLHFGIITPIAIIAGIPLMVIVFFILALAMLSLAAGSLWQPAGEAVNAMNARFAIATYSLAEAFADVPGGHHYRNPHDDEKHRVIVFDLPYGGGAHYLDMGGGVLLDCGGSSAFHRYVMPTLSALRARPDSLIVSHADAKHSGAMIHCLDYYDVKQALIPRMGLRSPSYRGFLARAGDDGCRLVTPTTGQFFQIEPGVKLETLHAPAELDGDGRADDTGLVLRLHCHGWRVLFTGDAGYLTEERLLRSGIDLHADIIVMGRNRDDFTSSPAFCRAVQPKAVISTNASFPHNESIPEAWKKRLNEEGIHLFDQLQTGAVTITMDADTLTLTPTLKTTSPLTLRRE